jgi:hypothetical protein
MSVPAYEPFGQFLPEEPYWIVSCHPTGYLGRRTTLYAIDYIYGYPLDTAYPFLYDFMLENAYASGFIRGGPTTDYNMEKWW